MSAATRAAPGTSSCNSSSRLAPGSAVRKFTPVALPPGRPMLATRPRLTGSSPTPKTIGMVEVAAFAARAPGGVPGTDDERIEGLSSEIEALARQDKGCERLLTLPGIGPILWSAMVAAIGTGDAFSKGRDFGAWLGLVPKQISTGDRTILGSISKRGNRYLRALFVQAAWVVLVKVGPKHWA